MENEDYQRGLKRNEEKGKEMKMNEEKWRELKKWKKGKMKKNKMHWEKTSSFMFISLDFSELLVIVGHFSSFLKRHDNSEIAHNIVELTKEEIKLYEKFNDYYSYGFYISKKLN